ncbi:MAG: hypothetical protein ACD_18C00281G0006, partial [uncultured bacterium]
MFRKKFLYVFVVLSMILNLVPLDFVRADNVYMVKNIVNSSASSYPANFIDNNGIVYFQATDGVNGVELWKSDNTEAGTVMVKNINVGGSSFPTSLALSNSILFFRSNDAVYGNELWKSDGTSTGTVMVKDINPGSSSVGSDPSRLIDVNGTLFFKALTNSDGFELWKSDGTSTGTVMVKNINPIGNSIGPFADPYFTNVNGILYFTATDGTNGDELWKSDGTEAGTVMVKNIYASSSNSSPANLTNVNGTLYFQATDSINGAELWKSDGTEAGTILVQDIRPGSVGSSIYYLTKVGSGIFFQATEGVNGSELWFVNSNTTPTLITLTATPATDAVGDITISSVVNDTDANDLTVSYAYEVGSCGSYVAQPSPTIVSSSDDNGVLTVTSNEPTGVSTAVADNTVESVWDISADSLIPNTQYCVYAFVNDGTVDSDVSTTTVYTNPAQPLSLTVTANGQTAANLTWTANSNPSTTIYKIYSDAGATLRGSTTSTSYTVTGLTAGNNYTFTVRAINNSDNTSYVESDTSSAIATAPIANAVTLTLQVNSGEPSYQFLSKLNEVHTAEVVSIIEDNSVLKAQVTIHSNPVTVTLAAGQSQNVDLNGDGTNDTTVTMNSVSSNQANFTLTFIAQGSPRFFDNPPKVVEGKEAIIINNGELTTNNKQVKLDFNVVSAKFMAISNDANFTNTSFENYTTTKDWTLIPGNGTKVVYAKFRSADGGTIVYTDTITLTGQKNDEIVNTLEKKEVVTNCSLIPGQAYKMKNSSVIYYITNDCTKQKIGNEKNYFSYFSNWSEVKTIDSTELNKVSLDKNKETAWGPKYDPKYGALVKTLNDPKVYLLLNDSKYWI